ncbi:hypothetical protein Efla_005209 [Eimeria flavescens]
MKQTTKKAGKGVSPGRPVRSTQHQQRPQQQQQQQREAGTAAFTRLPFLLSGRGRKASTATPAAATGVAAAAAAREVCRRSVVMELGADRAAEGGVAPSSPWDSSSSSSSSSNGLSSLPPSVAAGGSAGFLGGPSSRYGSPLSLTGPPSGAPPYGYSPVQQLQQQQQQGAPASGFFGGDPSLYQQQQREGGQLGPGMGGEPFQGRGPQGGPPCPRTMRVELQQLLSPEDRQTLQQIASRARASALAASLGLGVLAMNALKKRNWRFPILGASVIGLTVGPPIGFAGYMAFNYQTVQRMEAKFREAQALFEQQRMQRGGPPIYGPPAGGFGRPSFFGMGGGPSPSAGWRSEDTAAAAAAGGWGEDPAAGRGWGSQQQPPLKSAHAEQLLQQQLLLQKLLLLLQLLQELLQQLP